MVGEACLGQGLRRAESGDLATEGVVQGFAGLAGGGDRLVGPAKLGRVAKRATFGCFSLPSEF